MNQELADMTTTTIRQFGAYDSMANNCQDFAVAVKVIVTLQNDLIPKKRYYYRIAYFPRNFPRSIDIILFQL